MNRRNFLKMLAAVALVVGMPLPLLGENNKIIMIDGLPIECGNTFFLLKDCTNAADNGVYKVSGGKWSRR